MLFLIINLNRDALFTTLLPNLLEVVDLIKHNSALIHSHPGFWFS